tara:strand:+ start:2035 stop:2628 length:594 start_codon:yes stop_codon:yes gene_type:complete
MRRAKGVDTRRFFYVTVEAGSNLESKNEHGQTALMLAIKSNYERIVKILMDAGVDVNCVDDEGWTPLMFSCSRRGHEKYVRALVDAADSYGDTVLMVATTSKREQSVRTLLEAGADTDLCNAEGETAISLASKCGYENITRRLRVHRHWNMVRKMVRVRPYVLHWIEEHAKAHYAPEGIGQKCDRAAFEAAFVARAS